MLPKKVGYEHKNNGFDNAEKTLSDPENNPRKSQAIRSPVDS